jgi:hypothetical protein
VHKPRRMIRVPPEVLAERVATLGSVCQWVSFDVGIGWAVGIGDDKAVGKWCVENGVGEGDGVEEGDDGFGVGGGDGVDESNDGGVVAARRREGSMVSTCTATMVTRAYRRRKEGVRRKAKIERSRGGDDQERKTRTNRFTSVSKSVTAVLPYVATRGVLYVGGTPRMRNFRAPPLYSSAKSRFQVSKIKSNSVSRPVRLR